MTGTVEATNIQRYEDEWKRTNPDIVVYRPTEECGWDASNCQILVKKSILMLETLRMSSKSFKRIFRCSLLIGNLFFTLAYISSQY